MKEDAMKTDDLIAVLSISDPRPTRFVPTIAVTGAVCLALAIVLTISMVWLKPRGDLATGLLIYNHVFLLKLVFTMGIVLGALLIVRDLSVPGRRIGWGSVLASVPFVIVVIFALAEVTLAPTYEWLRHVGHASWLECLWEIPALAVPAFIILTVAVRGLAPTNLRRTGGYIGLLAGGIGAVGYALHCHDDAAAFVAIAYTLAIAEMAILGALIGPRILRWE